MVEVLKCLGIAALLIAGMLVLIAVVALWPQTVFLVLFFSFVTLLVWGVRNCP